MNVADLKSYILNNDRVEEVLFSLGCGHIRNHGEYITASNPDGNNKNAINLYLNENLTCINHTRQLTKQARTTDIFDLICFIKNLSFPEAMKYVCELCGLDFYGELEEKPLSLQIIQMLYDMASSKGESDNTPLKPIPEKILSYYLPYPNIMFEDDGISLEVQAEFELGYDAYSNMVTIPLRDPVGTLCGVKGRYFGEPEDGYSKYLHIEKCNKAKLLYGYYQNSSYIKNSKYIYIVEAEKGVLQLASRGIRNCVATGGKTISKTQVELISRSGCIPIFAFDKDVSEDELKEIASMFIDGISVYAIIDNGKILNEKESPTDDFDKWTELTSNHIYQLK